MRIALDRSNYKSIFKAIYRWFLPDDNVLKMEVAYSGGVYTFGTFPSFWGHFKYHYLGGKYLEEVQEPMFWYKQAFALAVILILWKTKQLSLPLFLLAVAKDSSADGAYNGTGTHTVALTIVSSTNTILFAGVECNTASVTGVTWNGGAITQLTTVDEAGAPFTGRDYVYYKLAPASGSHNAVLSWNGGGNSNFGLVCYSGALQSAPTIFATSSSNSSGDRTPTLTTTAANSWVFIWGAARSTPTPTAAGSTINTYSTSSSYDFIGDTGNITTAGSVTAGCNMTSADGNVCIAVVVAPVAAGASFIASQNKRTREAINRGSTY